MIYSILFLLFTSLICSQQNVEINIDEVLQHLQAKFSQIKDYSVQLHAEIDMAEINIPPMDVTVYFKQPDKIHLESKGFAMIPREGMIINPTRFNKQNFYISFLGKDSLNTAETYKLELIPKKEEIMIRKINLWVDPDIWVILKVRTISWQGQSTLIKFSYSRIQNKFWLPTGAIATINLTGFKGFSDVMRMPKEKTINSSTKTGKLTIRFFNYKINSGLSDSIFEGK